MSILSKIFKSRNSKILKKYNIYLEKVNSFEEEFKNIDNKYFYNKTEEYKKRLENGESIYNFICEAIALVREASRRTIGLRHHDVQIIGGLALFENNIAEMKTGEGKTLVATIPLYLKSLYNKTSHLITVNDYLAKRDGEWNAPIYLLFGISVGIITSERCYTVSEIDGKITSSECQKSKAYSCGVVYGTNNEFGFDYLRDHMVMENERKVQKNHFYAIVDEVDSILIDEARTPLIISGPSEKSTDKYSKMNKILSSLIRSGEFNECSKDKDGEYIREDLGTTKRYIDDGDYRIDEKDKSVVYTEDGLKKIETKLLEQNEIPQDSSIFDPINIAWVSHAELALKAHKHYIKDRDYLIKNKEILIVDEFTGRVLSGRRYSGGLHQAIEAKERVTIRKENQTLATISFQNYFRMYENLAGMTATAKTEEQEFYNIYDLEVIQIPTNLPVARIDASDKIYRTAEEKDRAIINEIIRVHKKGQPILVGTVSVESSEHLSKLLKKKKISHQVLNAKHHDSEATIIQEAGRPGSVTIATNMAGRGTDIKLGGHDQSQREKVLNAGGLYVLGTERHESRRIDNQLKGRSGRQGDPGESRFFISLDDDLMRLFGSDRLSNMMQSLGFEKDQPLEHKLISNAIEKAQKKVEQRNYDIRKHLLEYDNVLNKQRTFVYELRDNILENKKIKETINESIENFIWDIFDEREIGKNINSEESLDIIDFISKSLNLEINSEDFDNLYKTNDFADNIINLVRESIFVKFNRLPEKDRFFIEKAIILQAIDNQWKDHLLNNDILKDSISFKSYGKDPLTMYKLESFKLFEEMRSRVDEHIVKTMSLLQISENPAPLFDDNAYEPSTFNHKKVGQFESNKNNKPQNTNRGRYFIPSDKEAKNPYKNVGRNDPCPCGSGKKFKKCCGRK